MMTFDVVINGAGMVGSSISIALAKAGFKVLVLEHKELSLLYPQKDYGLRVSAFTSSSQNWFEYLGVWNKIGASGRVCPFFNMNVWDEGGLGSLQFKATDVKQDYLGWIIDNAVVQGALLDSAKEYPNITFWESTQIKQIQHQKDGFIDIHCSNQEIIRSGLLIGADGGHSLVRDLAGISCIGWTYGQKTIVGQVKTEKFHENACWQRFLKNGPVALLPLSDGRCSLAWHTTHMEADHLLSLSNEEIAKKLESAFNHRFGSIMIEERLGAYPLRLNHAKSYISNNIALAGDAAHNIHPLAGLGVNIGFMDAAVLADTLIKAKASNNLMLGDKSTLKSYERKRMPHNIAVMGAMDTFKRLSGIENTLLRSAMNKGLSVVDKITPLKKQLASIAIGRYGKLPTFMKVN